MKKILASLSVIVTPALLFAQDFSSIDNALDTVSDFINRLIPFLIGLAVLFFIYGLIKFVSAGGDPGKQEEARNTIIWGIIIIFVMVSVWGLVNVLVNTFGLENQVPQDIPEVPYR
jgi:TM2 domain-containing membrane protein YozV